MQKFYYSVFITLIFYFSLFLSSLFAMNKPEETVTFLPDNSDIKNILKVDDSVKLGILVQQIANKPILGHLKNDTEKLDLFKQSKTELDLLQQGIAIKLNTLSQQALDPWNKERLKGLGKSFLWTVSTTGLLVVQSFLYFSDSDPNIKIIAGIPLMFGVIGSFAQFFKHANKTINNSHINEKIENHLEKTTFIHITKQDLENNIERLEKEIEKRKIPLSSSSSELDEIRLN